MQTQTVFKAGNSNVVSIPKPLLKETGIKVGDKVILERVGSGFVVKKADIEKDKGEKKAKKEFKKWLDTFMDENGEILDELAVR